MREIPHHPHWPSDDLCTSTPHSIREVALIIWLVSQLVTSFTYNPIKVDQRDLHAVCTSKYRETTTTKYLHHTIYDFCNIDDNNISVVGFHFELFSWITCNRELLNMPKQELHIIIVALHFLVKGYGMIFQLILNFVHLYLVLKMPCTSIW